MLLNALEPFDAALAQSEAKLYDTNTEPVLAASQEAGTEPDLISNLADVPIAVSIASNCAFLTVTLNWTEILASLYEIIKLIDSMYLYS